MSFAHPIWVAAGIVAAAAFIPAFILLALDVGKTLRWVAEKLE